MSSWYRTWGKFLIYHDHILMNKDLQIAEFHVLKGSHSFEWEQYREIIILVIFSFQYRNETDCLSVLMIIKSDQIIHYSHFPGLARMQFWIVYDNWSATYESNSFREIICLSLFSETKEERFACKQTWLWFLTLYAHPVLLALVPVTLKHSPDGNSDLWSQ